MKNFFVIFFVVFSVSIFFAHAPTDVNVYLDSSNNIIVVEVQHDISKTKVMDTAKHFIKEIIVKINGKVIETKKFKMQDSSKDQMTAFTVPRSKIKMGDKITVEAKCNLSGILSGELMVK